MYAATIASRKAHVEEHMQLKLMASGGQIQSDATVGVGKSLHFRWFVPRGENF